jgi:hypothetical protein
MKKLKSIVSTLDRPATKRSVLGGVGLFAGIVAFALAVLPFWIDEPAESNQSLGDIIAEKTVELGEKAVTTLTIRSGEPQAAARSGFDWYGNLGTFSAVLAVSAIVLGVLSFVRREDLRVCGGAVALGGAALAWHYLMIALIVIAVAIFLGGLLGTFGGG